MATVRRDTPHNLNDEMCFKVKSVCGNLTESEWVERCFYLLKGGGGELPVTDFKCTWYYEEPIHCTWHLETDAPPLAKYILMYRYDNTNRECQEYTHTQGPSNGCTFVNRKYDALDNINILITDSSMKLGRFYTSFDPHDILQSRPPSIKVSKSNDIDKIYVEWNDSMSEVKDYQVETKDSKSQKWTNYSVSNTNSFVISRARQDAMYTVRVRTKFDDHFGGKLWSDWSTEASIGEHHDDDWTMHYILLPAVPLFVVTVAIVLLVFMKRLRILIFPPIPDPSKLFRNMFSEQSDELQHWIKHDSAMFPSKPVKEETCSVILVETVSPVETQTF
ncbi:interleukin-13 receptor subunit alpha-1 isoform X2 [Ambystoma mexicanum]